jgi:hypothetical protein
MGGLIAAIGNVSWLSQAEIEDAVCRVAPGRGVLELLRGPSHMIGVQHRGGEAAVGECSPGLIAAVHGVVEDVDSGPLDAGARGKDALRLFGKWRGHPDGFLADAAIIAWDEPTGRLESMRGWSTHRPLFWTAHRGAILLASEIRVLLRLCRRAWVADPEVEVAFLAGRAQPLDASGCVGVGLVPAGARLVFAMDGGRMAEAPQVAELGLPDPTRVGLASSSSPTPESIAQGLISIDREIASLGEPIYHLSSGVDSSTLVLAALASRRGLQSGVPVACYTRSFPGTPSDERAQVEMFCRGRSINWTVESQDQARIDEVWAECATSLDFLVGPTIYGALSSARHAAASKHSLVVAGIGGDELFGAYEHLCGDAGIGAIWRHRGALNAWFGGSGLIGEVKAASSVLLARWRSRAEFAKGLRDTRRALHWRVRLCASARGKLASEQLHEREGVSLEAPLGRGLVLNHVSGLSELARLSHGQSKGLLRQVRLFLAGPLEPPQPAKVVLDHATPLALRLCGKAPADPVLDRAALHAAWRRSIVATGLSDHSAATLPL